MSKSESEINNKLKEDLSSLNDQELEVYFVKKAYKLTEEDISASQFIFWLIYYMERRLTDLMKDNLKGFIKCSDGSAQKATDLILDELHLSGKVRAFEKSLPPSKELKRFCDYYMKVNDIRNQLFHNKAISTILYRDKSVKNRTIKEIMIKDLFVRLNACAVKLKEQNQIKS